MQKGVVITIILVLILSLITGYTISSTAAKKDLWESYYSDGWIYTNNGEYDKALEEFNKYLKKNPNNVYALAGIGNIQRYQGNHLEAISTYNKAIEITQKNFASLHGLGWSYYYLYIQTKLTEKEQKEQLFKNSEQYLLQAVNIRKSHTGALRGLGLLYLKQAEITLNKEYYEKAIEYFDKALETNPGDHNLANDAAAAQYLKDLRFNQSNVDYAYVVSLFEESALIKPTSTALIGAGLAQAKSGDIDSAKESFEKASELNNNNLDAQHGKGLILIDEKKYAEAVQVFEDLVARDPENPRRQRALGIAYTQNNQLDEAEKVFLKTIQENENYLPGYINLVYIYHLQGNNQKAQETLNTLLSIESDLMKINYWSTIVPCMEALNEQYTVSEIASCYDLM